jgi:hypothetical protein
VSHGLQGRDEQSQHHEHRARPPSSTVELLIGRTHNRRGGSLAELSTEPTAPKQPLHTGEHPVGQRQ